MYKIQVPAPSQKKRLIVPVSQADVSACRERYTYDPASASVKVRKEDVGARKAAELVFSNPLSLLPVPPRYGTLTVVQFAYAETHGVADVNFAEMAEGGHSKVDGKDAGIFPDFLGTMNPPGCKQDAQVALYMPGGEENPCRKCAGKGRDIFNLYYFDTAIEALVYLLADPLQRHGSESFERTAEDIEHQLRDFFRHFRTASDSTDAKYFAINPTYSNDFDAYLIPCGPGMRPYQEIYCSAWAYKLLASKVEGLEVADPETCNRVQRAFNTRTHLNETLETLMFDNFFQYGTVEGQEGTLQINEEEEDMSGNKIYIAVDADPEGATENFVHAPLLGELITLLKDQEWFKVPQKEGKPVQKQSIAATLRRNMNSETMGLFVCVIDAGDCDNLQQEALAQHVCRHVANCIYLNAFIRNRFMASTDPGSISSAAQFVSILRSSVDDYPIIDFEGASD